MPVIKYDPAIRNTECGKHLYNTWRRIRRQPHCEEWESFPTFYEWAANSDYEFGAQLRRNDENKPFNVENCVWYLADECARDYEWCAQFAEDWNRAVNRIRKHYGMPPLEGTKYGD